MSKAKDPISSLSHMIGAVLFGVGTVVLLLKGLLGGFDAITVLSALVFGLSLIALYSASAAYHFVNASEQVNLILRKLDHSMIYVLIAGSYTPILLHYYHAPHCYWLTAAIWAIGLTGIAVKLLWFNAPRMLYTAFYILMGWFVLFDLSALQNMAPGAIALLVGGGLSYTAGGIIYALKKPNFSKRFGHHELFHILVLLGSLQHYIMVLGYVM